MSRLQIIGGWLALGAAAALVAIGGEFASDGSSLQVRMQVLGYFLNVVFLAYTLLAAIGLVAARLITKK